MILKPADYISKAKKACRFIFRIGKKYLANEPYIPKEIPVLSIEITNTCNSKCVFCANISMKRRKEYLDTGLFRKVVDQYILMGGDIINFNCLIGEPLLDPHLLERIRYVKSFPQIRSLTFFSTLQWLHRYDIKEFIASGVDTIYISLTLSGREKYKEFYGVDHYDHVIKNLVALIEENNRSANKMGIELSIKPTDENINNIRRHADFTMIDKLLQGGASRALDEMGLGVHDFSSVVKLPTYLRKRPLYPRNRRPCRLLYDHLKIFSNGKVGLCVCSDYEANSDLIVGHVQDGNLSDIWRGDKVRQIRDNWRVKNIVPGLCKKCGAYVY
jgi:MoaA/NifB/PqqE/SkfB family radical SAM enzyme